MLALPSIVATLHVSLWNIGRGNKATSSNQLYEYKLSRKLSPLQFNVLHPRAHVPEAYQVRMVPANRRCRTYMRNGDIAVVGGTPEEGGVSNADPLEFQS